MTKKMTIQSIALLVGVLCSIATFEIHDSSISNSGSIEIIDNSHDFWSIFLNNLIVGLIISVGGYFSGGLLVLIIIFWNAFFLTEIIQTSLVLKLPFNEIIYGLIYHGPTEILAFLLFGAIGLNGWEFYKRLFYENKVTCSELASIKLLYIPILLLIFSAIIESNL